MAENVVIIGSGPGGYTAALYASRANLRPVVFEGFTAGGSAGGQLMTTSTIENFPGFPDGIEGPELMQRLQAQARKFGAVMHADDVSEVRLTQRPFTVISLNGRTVQTHTLIVATGAAAKRLPLDSEKEFWGRGVSACAVCDGGLPLFRGKELAVIGGGDSAVEEAIHLTHFASRVYLIHRRDQLRASAIMQKRAEENATVEILWNKVVDEIFGERTVQGIKLKDTKTGEVSELSVAGVFEAIGHQPNTGFLKGLVELDDDGYVVTRHKSTATSVEGVFAAGDVQDKTYRQAITAAGTGCMAAIEAERWLQEKALA